MNKTTSKENTMSKKFGVCAPMGFAFYFFVSWLIIVIFTFMRKGLSFIENSFIILLILIISINFSWITSAELNLIELSTRPINYTAFMLNRSINIPFVIIIALNLIKSINSTGRSVLITVCSILVLVILARLGSTFEITHREKWSILNDFIYVVLLHIFAFITLKFYRGSKQSEAIS
ncbi:hypothetical protein M3226_20065 [Neobacillus cucumis]|uniref:hypothetical protein n=1 Tax=Neobacillus cucumis TaxID=1740721 RepID=UPI00203AB06A|nr:hypothetical protein [Neobacillus cucumis]MCM3727947.1 hypothetical protein [Neobacillus cucumis]